MSVHPPAQAREPVPDTYSPDANKANGIRDVAVRRSDKLLVLQSMFSVVCRTIAYLFLRVIPGSFGFYAIHFYLGYLAIWVLYDVRVASQKTRRMPSLSSLVFGHSTSNRPWNIVQLVVHTLVLLFVLDLYYMPYLFPSHREASLKFARVGALSSSSATLHVRYPEPLPRVTGLWETGIQEALVDASDINEAPLRIVWRRVHESEVKIRAPSTVRDPRRWERGPVLHLSNESDWTATATLFDLWPATKYEWRLAFVHNNTFAPMPERPIPFVTWPDSRLSAYGKSKFVPTNKTSSIPLDDPNHFSFATLSCIKPDFPYHPAQFWGWNWLLRMFGIGTQPGGITSRNSIRGFDLMADHYLRRSKMPSLRFLLELGDLIYADVPRYEGPDIGSYRKLYRNVFASHSFRRVYQSIPVMGIFDDHEIINNWSGAGYTNATEDEDRPQAPAGIHAGLNAWNEYIGHANPSPAVKNRHYYSFRYGDSAFFVLDVRGHRTHPQSAVDTPTIPDSNTHQTQPTKSSV